LGAGACPSRTPVELKKERVFT
jgi:hypothetical protein